MPQVGPCRIPAPNKLPLLRSWVQVVIHSWTSCDWVDFLTWCGSLAVAFYCPCFGRCNTHRIRIGGFKPHKSGSFFSGKSFKFGHFFTFKCLPALVTVACLQRCLVADPSSFYFSMFWFLQILMPEFHIIAMEPGSILFLRNELNVVDVSRSTPK